MKKLVSLILICMVIMSISITAFATDSVLGDGADDNTTTITGNEYQDAQQNTANNNSNNNSALPQTGSQDYAIAILFVLFATGATFAYKKVSDYRDI